eukprot:GHVQ01029892.1.p1 GENE.GHVQ01029892.1~~GHVQ01029892.1.p1  ORF type:complete len:262 (+),score=19.09 GHVQ01029892.1:132-917(+)
MSSSSHPATHPLSVSPMISDFRAQLFYLLIKNEKGVLWTFFWKEPENCADVNMCGETKDCVQMRDKIGQLLDGEGDFQRGSAFHGYGFRLGSTKDNCQLLDFGDNTACTGEHRDTKSYSVEDLQALALNVGSQSEEDAAAYIKLLGDVHMGREKHVCALAEFIIARASEGLLKKCISYPLACDSFHQAFHRSVTAVVGSEDGYQHLQTEIIFSKSVPIGSCNEVVGEALSHPSEPQNLVMNLDDNCDFIREPSGFLILDVM